jgi:hypothetical protein
MVQQQAAFLLDAALLIRQATALGFTVTGGELWRTAEQQEIYLKSGRSKTKASQHLNRMAIDLNFFRDGGQVLDREQLKSLGLWWEGLNALNRWGGSWRGQIDAGKSNFIDLPHFERQLA